ncbi:piRNA biogenesis protein EXD1 isoform X1 [Scyliorhinus canicula]|uniref:piRNA biogenesis protein EXD1 isoform X1 n=1 Tax=Scyliorhinus canicula TaxID=7830 RepID=UPI0018F697C8|nr:piRNA biogenesis protein EXD1 isoform X1 [Scyliorhinus canicula]
MDSLWFREILSKRVKVTLVCGTYSGCLRHVDAASKAIILDQVEDLENNRKLPGIKMFFGYEIKNLEILDALSTNFPNESATKTTNVNNNKRDKPEDTTPEKTFHKQHFSELEDESLEYILIDQFQQKFGPAIFHIKQQSVIGVAVEGIDICRFGKLCLIQIATNDQIYLFDIFLLGPVAFKNGLKMILEDSDILKVIHDCRLVSDCLYHQYRVGLTNIFDTQVADVLQFSLETGGLLPSCVSTLEESLVCHLCLPPTKILFLQRSARAVKVNPKVWTCRPLPTGLMQRAGLDVMYLLSLRSTLMDKLMVDFTTQVDNYLSMYRNMPCINLGSAEDYLMELPYELKELTVIQRLRREDALKNYKTDENGLLVRPCPQSEKIPEMKGRVVNIDDIPELEATDPSGENVLEMQNEDIPLLEPSPDCGEDRCPPLEEVSHSTF